MARKKLPMRHIQEILRLKHQNHLSLRDIARSCELAVSTIGDYLKRAQAAALTWPLPEGMTEEELTRKLFGGPPPTPPPIQSQSLPDWTAVHEELRRKGVTLQLLWQEYRQAHPEGYSYSRYCELYQAWAGTLCPVLRQTHAPGEKMFVDWAGQTVPIGQAEGTDQAAQVFVAVLGFSNKTFAEAHPNQQLASWVSAHAHAYVFFSGVARVTVPDNTKTAVTKPCRYEPILHRSYQEMAAHYGTVILPARPKKPRDKAKAESAVLVAERHILAALRDRHFFSIGELNQAIAPLVAQLNDKPFQKLEGTRNSWFEEERAKLLPLPAQPFELATWSKVKVNIDYHVVVENHFYSVPYTLIHQQLEVRLTDTTVELFKSGKRVAAHPRSYQRGRCTTLAEHRPKAHQKHLQWTPGRMVQWAGTIGPQCAKLVEHILENRPHPEMGFRSCLGIIRLGKAVGSVRLEAACRRAWHFGTCSYGSVKSILNNHLEALPLEPELPLPSPSHQNLRGGPYYN
jgi:transposase